jgi:hypothetical protein
MSNFVKPLDEVFNIESEHNGFDDYEMVPESALPATTPQEPAPYVRDEDDIETDRKLDEVYNEAKKTFQNQMSYTEIIEPRYAARNAEVAATFLNIALAAATSKARVKTDRKRANTFIPGMGSTKITNNTVVATREEILRMIDVDGTKKEIK